MADGDFVKTDPTEEQAKQVLAIMRQFIEQLYEQPARRGPPGRGRGQLENLTPALITDVRGVAGRAVHDPRRPMPEGAESASCREPVSMFCGPERNAAPTSATNAEFPESSFMSRTRSTTHCPKMDEGTRSVYPLPHPPELLCGTNEPPRRREIIGIEHVKRSRPDVVAGVLVIEELELAVRVPSRRFLGGQVSRSSARIWITLVWEAMPSPMEALMPVLMSAETVTVDQSMGLRVMVPD